MTELLNRVLDSHCGLHNWSKVLGASLRLSVGGPFWQARGWPEISREQIVTFDAHRRHMTLTPFVGTATTAIFDGDDTGAKVLIKDATQVLEEREDPPAAFPPFTETTRWDALSLAYFTGAALWNSFVEPFAFTFAGVGTEEIEPWREGEETWRRLRVTFPSQYPNLNSEQVFYYDSHLLQRRVDYAPDMLGGIPLAHYTFDPQTYEGMVFYTRQTVHPRDARGTADKDSTLLTIDMDSVSVQCK